jgi:predicted lipid-binding transport protein (Tim44 family)
MTHRCCRPQSVAHRLTGVLAAGVAAMPLAVADAGHHTASLVIGAAAVVAATLITTLGSELFWLLALILPARERRWNARQAGSIDELIRLNRTASAAHAKVVAARAATADGAGSALTDPHQLSDA